jgi:multiple sugar transport system ATP-binding protein
MAEVTLKDVTKVYGEDVVPIRDMNLDIPEGEFVVFVGPSGSGKSTAVRMIAGLEDITQGKVFIGDNVVNDLPPRERDRLELPLDLLVVQHLLFLHGFGKHPKYHLN